MPLSEHEQRVLEQIEKALYADDPKFAASVRESDLRRHYLRQLRRCIAVIVLGLAVLLAGVIIKSVPLGVLAFAVMLTAGLRLVSAVRGLTGHAAPPAVAGERKRRGRGPGSGPAAGKRSSQSPPRQSFTERAEERYRRRFEQD